MVKAVIFDMDGVLIDSERVCCECWEEVSRDMKLGDLSEGVMGCIGLNRNDSMSLMQRLYGEDFPYEECHVAVNERIKQKFREEGIPIKEGVQELFDYLKAKDYVIGLASSTGKKSVVAEMEQIGLIHYFQAIVTGDMVEHSKPNPDIYLKACKELGVEPEEAIAIEDSLNGIRAAYHAGMKPIMVPDLIAPTPEIEEMLYAKFDSLLEVRDYLKKKA